MQSFPNAVAGTADDPADASAGTADNPADESAGADGSTPDGSGWQEEQAAAGGDPQSADGLESSLGSAQDYEEQQAEVAAELSNYGIVRAPSVIFAVPIGPYYVPRIFSSQHRYSGWCRGRRLFPTELQDRLEAFPGDSSEVFATGAFHICQDSTADSDIGRRSRTLVYWCVAKAQNHPGPFMVAARRWWRSTAEAYAQ
jgi:hypothetical protein